MISFEWDNNKNNINIEKHGVSFIEASTAFYDNNALVIYDPDHSVVEERYILLGLSKKGRILVISHCYRTKDEIIRIISARTATLREMKQYYKAKE